ncbi:MAG: hypothetical protein AB7G39_08370 [Alphaproteobacteria bacterium]
MHLRGKSEGSHLGQRRRARASLFVRMGRTVFYIRPGSKMTIRNADGTLETATVHSLSVDVSGIPHVTYGVQIARPHGLGTLRETGRILALTEFMNRYAQGTAPRGVLARIKQRLRHSGYAEDDGATVR